MLVILEHKERLLKKPVNEDNYKRNGDSYGNSAKTFIKVAKHAGVSIEASPQFDYPTSLTEGRHQSRNVYKVNARYKPKKRLPIARKILIALLCLAVIGFGYYVYSFGILPLRYALGLAGALLLVTTLLTVGLIKTRRKFSAICVYFLTLLFIGAMSFGVFTMQKGANLLNQITGQTGKTVEFSAIVLTDSSLQSAKDLQGIDLPAAFVDTQYFDRLKEASGASDVKSAGSYTELIRDLYNDKWSVVVLNEGFRSVIDEIYPMFGENTRVIATFTIKEDNIESTELFGKNSSAFNIYISGIDTYGDISYVSRSDVNIVLTINPDTKEILLTTIPRDSYVSIAGGGNDQYDKLTHAGIYGVDSSIQTLENLLETDIQAYVRLNFSSLVSLVDKIGGIVVQNPVAFTTDGGQSFAAGSLSLNGAQALTFSRERHNLAGGDLDRGINQQRVIMAIFNKISSPALLSNYQDILTAVSESIETNISAQDITKFANFQLNYGGKWQIDNNIITGHGQTGGLPSYAMPSHALYMYVLDEAALESTKQRVGDVLQVD